MQPLLGETVLAWLLTYAIHSTLLLGGAWLLFALRPRLSADLREMVWKLALFGAVFTSLVQTWLPVPRWLPDVLLSSAVDESASEDEVSPGSARRHLHEVTRSVALPVSSQAVTLGIPRSDVEPSFVIQRDELRSAGLIPSARLLIGGWIAISSLLLLRLAWRIRCLRKIAGATCRDASVLDRLAQLKAEFDIRGSVRLIETRDGIGPMAAGLLSYRVYCPARWLKTLDQKQLDALLAHELAHLARGDSWWNLAAETACALFFFQPLNFLARRQIREQAEFLADRQAAAALCDGLGLARCLVQLAESRMFVGGTWQTSVAVGMTAYRSRLGQRVARLCAPERDRPLSTFTRRLTIATLLGTLLILPMLAPGASAQVRERTPGEPTMELRSTTSAAWLMAALGWAAAAPADDDQPVKKPAAESRQDVNDKAPLVADKLTDAIGGFDGQIAGIVRARKEGVVLFEVSKVVQVWEKSNKAPQPESLAGTKIIVGPFREQGRPAELQVKFLAKIKIGDDARLNVRQVGDAFVITELTQEQREFAAGKNTSDKPLDREPVVKDEPAQALSAEERGKFPEGARGLSGRVVGRLLSKDAEKGELMLDIAKVDRVWPGSNASAPKTLEGRSIRIEKVFGRFLDVLLTLKEGDGVQIEVKHVSGEGLVFLGEELKKVPLENDLRDSRQDEQPKPKDSSNPKPAAEPKPTEEATDAPPGMAGFRGILAGELISTDVEQGSFVFKLESVKRTWPQNKAPAPEKSKGKSIQVDGVFGKWLDVLLTLKPGDKVEVEANHIRGQSLKFPGEWLKKVATEDAK